MKCEKNTNSSITISPQRFLSFATCQYPTTKILLLWPENFILSCREEWRTNLLQQSFRVMVLLGGLHTWLVWSVCFGNWCVFSLGLFCLDIYEYGNHAQISTKTTGLRPPCSGGQVVNLDQRLPFWKTASLKLVWGTYCILEQLSKTHKSTEVYKDFSKGLKEIFNQEDSLLTCYLHKHILLCNEMLHCESKSRQGENTTLKI